MKGNLYTAQQYPPDLFHGALLLSFDIDDTLAESKQPLPPQMADVLATLLELYKIHVITGGKLEIILNNVVSPLLKLEANITNLFASPSMGGALVRFDEDGRPITVYERVIPIEDFEYIRELVLQAAEELGYIPDQPFGEIIEYRRTSITFSALGQNAPLELKRAFDPTREKRKRLLERIKDKIPPQYTVRIGGTTSLDFAFKEVNKGYGLQKVQEYLRLDKDEIVFFGDSLFEEGNDFPVLEAGFNCIEVKSWHETYDILSRLVK